MALTLTSVATDSFTDTDSTNLEAHGSGSWALLITAAAGYTGIVSNALQPKFGNTVRSIHRWAGAGTIGDDQYSQITIVAIGGDSTAKETGLVVRASADTNATADYYEWYFVANSPRSTVMRKVVNGTATTLGTVTTIAWADGDVMALAVVGTTLYGLRNGAIVVTVTGQADLTTGKPGIAMRGLTGGSIGVVVDSWAGGTAAEAADTDAPTLTSPTGTSTGTTTASGTVSTDEANGTLYRLASINATELAATVKAAALTTSVTAIGSQSVTFTGLTASTTYYAHYVHTDPAGNDSARVSSPTSFTTSAAGDTTEPTQAGAITVGTVTSTSIEFSWPAGADNVGVVGYDVSSNSGSTWTTLGNVLTHTFSGLSASTTYGLRVRPRDAAGNVDSTPLAASQATSSAPATASLTSSPLKNNTGTLLAAVAFEAYVNNPTTGALVIKKTGLTSNGSGVVTFTDAALTAATSYRVVWRRTDTGAEGLETLTAT